MYYHKIKTATDKGSVLYKTATDPKNPWKIQVENTMMSIKMTGWTPNKNQISSKKVCEPKNKRTPRNENIQSSRNQIKGERLYLPKNN